jgi:putative flippase GtrA
LKSWIRENREYGNAMPINSGKISNRTEADPRNVEYDLLTAGDRGQPGPPDIPKYLILNGNRKNFEKFYFVRSILKIHPTLVQFFQFAGIGLVGTAAHFSGLILLVHLFAVQVVIASGFGFVMGALVNYSLNYVFTFRSNKKHTEALVKFFAVAAIGLAFNSAIMAITTTIFKMHYLPGQVIATGSVLIWNFIGNRFWTFQEKANATGN